MRTTPSNEGRRFAGSAVALVLVLLLIAVIVLFVWRPWAPIGSEELDTTVPEIPGPHTVPELPGPESEAEPFSSQRPDPSYRLIA